MADSRYCAACGRMVAMGVHYCPADSRSQAAPDPKDVEIDRLKTELKKHQKYDRCLEDYGLGCERVQALKAQVADLTKDRDEWKNAAAESGYYL